MTTYMPLQNSFQIISKIYVCMKIAAHIDILTVCVVPCRCIVDVNQW